MIEGNVAEDFYSHTKLKTCRILDIHEYPVHQEEDDSRMQ